MHVHVKRAYIDVLTSQCIPTPWNSDASPVEQDNWKINPNLPQEYLFYNKTIKKQQYLGLNYGKNKLELLSWADSQVRQELLLGGSKQTHIAFA